MNKELNIRTIRLNALRRVKRRMVRGHDDFHYCYCIDIDDWNDLIKKIKEE